MRSIAAALSGYDMVPINRKAGRSKRLGAGLKYKVLRLNGFMYIRVFFYGGNIHADARQRLDNPVL